MTGSWQSADVGALTKSGVARVFQPLTRGATVIYMLHRFEDRERGVSGFDPTRVPWSR